MHARWLHSTSCWTPVVTSLRSLRLGRDGCVRTAGEIDPSRFCRVASRPVGDAYALERKSRFGLIKWNRTNSEDVIATWLIQQRVWTAPHQRHIAAAPHKPLGARQAPAPPVVTVVGDWKSRVRKVGADLVSAAGERKNAHKRRFGRRVCANQGNSGVCILGTGSGWSCGRGEAGAGVPRERHADQRLALWEQPCTIRLQSYVSFRLQFKVTRNAPSRASTTSEAALSAIRPGDPRSQGPHSQLEQGTP